MTGAQAALAHVRARAQRRSRADEQRLRHALRGEKAAPAPAQLVERVRRSCRLTINFHPDRLVVDGGSVADGLLKTGEYRSQWMTGTSSGGRTAVPVGDRERWETELFGDAYDDPGAVRPVYGALDVTKDPFGGSPRFGSCFLVLQPQCLGRATICMGDSHLGPSDVGTLDALTGVLAALFESAGAGNALDRGLSTSGLLACLSSQVEASQPARELDHYLEAQIHGVVRLDQDVAGIVVDPSFRGTPAGTTLAAAADRFGFVLRWHCGSELAAVDVPDDYRGPDMRPLAATIVGAHGVLDAAAIGRSAARVPFAKAPPGGDAFDSPFQQHKRLWHCLVRFGHSP